MAAVATATGDGRGGHTRSSDGIVDLDLAVPKEMGGPGGEKSNPEQLFAADHAACFAVRPGWWSASRRPTRAIPR